MALSFSPSLFWEGSDGPWSTFTIRIGSSTSQVVRLLPATSQSTIWTVLPQGCPTGAPANCSTLRGLTFDPNSSSSFAYNDHNSSRTYALQFLAEAAVSTNVSSYDGGAYIGFDEIGLGISGDDGPKLESQTLVCYAVPNPFIGQFGLQAASNSITNNTDGLHYSPLGYLNATGSISSATFGYTAGSYGRNTLGSLTFGGYDAARGNVDSVLNTALSRTSDYHDLQLAVTGLQIGSTTVAAFPSSATYFIDSMVPEIWLPEDVCEEIATAFGLVYSPEWEVYYVNSTQHENLTSLASSTTSLTFTLQGLDDPGSTTQIELLYSDLNHQLSYPEDNITDASTSYRYFPIRRANSSDQYYFGRTFLQAAYLGVDYDHNRFNISPALFPAANYEPSIVPIINHKTSSPAPHPGLSGGDIAGIVIGSVAAIAIIAGLAFFYRSKRRTRRMRYSAATTLRPSIDGTTINNDGRPDMGYFEPVSQDLKSSSHPHHEHYNKGPLEMDGEEQDKFRPELAGSFAYREMSGSRHELYGSSIRRVSDQSRASISPLPRGESQRGKFRHLRQESESSFGQPSPASLTNSPPLGPDHLSGHPSPPMEMVAALAGPFELPGASRTEHGNVTSAPSVAVETTNEPARAHPDADLPQSEDTNATGEESRGEAPPGDESTRNIHSITSQ